MSNEDFKATVAADPVTLGRWHDTVTRMQNIANKYGVHLDADTLAEHAWAGLKLTVLDPEGGDYGDLEGDLVAHIPAFKKYNDFKNVREAVAREDSQAMEELAAMSPAERIAAHRQAERAEGRKPRNEPTKEEHVAALHRELKHASPGRRMSISRELDRISGDAGQ